MKHYVLYHANCLDGLGAAWAMQEFLKRQHIHDAKFIPVQYGQPLPEIEDGATVFIVDFSYPRDVLIELAARVTQITVMDHHVSAARQLIDLPDNVRTIFDMNRSGAIIVWQECFPADDVPAILTLIQDRDLWVWKFGEYSRNVTTALYSYDMTLETFSGLMQIDDRERLDIEGCAIRRQQAKEIDSLIKHQMEIDEFGGYSGVAILDCPPHLASMAAEKILADYPNVPLVRLRSVSFHDCVQRYSLRSRKGSGVDVSKIAEQRGGGGHPAAAGYSLPIDPR